MTRSLPGEAERRQTEPSDILVAVLGETMALASALTWSVAVCLFKRSESVPPLGLNLFKNVVTVALIGLTMLALGGGVDLDRPAGEWIALAASGILGIAVADTLVFVALRRLGAGLLAVVETVYAPFVVVLSILLLGEVVRPVFLAGAGLVVGGIAYALWDRGLVRRAAPAGTLGVGIAAGVTGIAAMAVGVVLAKPSLEAGDLSEVMFVRIVFGLAGQALWLALDRDRSRILAVFRPAPVWRSLVPAAVLGNYVAMFLWLGGFKWASASTAAVLNQMATVFTIVMARLLLAEAVGPRRVVGAAAAVAGAILVVLTRPT